MKLKRDAHDQKTHDDYGGGGGGGGVPLNARSRTRFSKWRSDRGNRRSGIFGRRGGGRSKERRGCGCDRAHAHAHAHDHANNSALHEA